MRKIIISILCFFSALSIYAQTDGVSINTTGNDPDPSAMLDIQSSDKGILLPRMTTPERDSIDNPALGLMIYNIDDSCFNYFAGTRWVKDCGRQEDIFTPPKTFSFGGTSIDRGTGIVTDPTGNSYFIGSFDGTATWGDTTLSSHGQSDIIVAKADLSGNIAVISQIGETGKDRGVGISLDSNGNIYITGSFSGTVDFGDTTLTSAGGIDLFVAKINPMGNISWAFRAGGTGFDNGYSISTDGAGSSYISGYFQGVADFGGTNLTSNGSTDIFALKIDPSGQMEWVLQAGTTSLNSGQGIDFDASGNSFVIGEFNGTTSFGSTNLTSNGGRDVFVAKINPLGQFVWASQWGGAGSDRGTSISTDPAGNSYITGYFEGNVNFGSTSLSNNGNRDVFVAKINPLGQVVWASSFGGSDHEYPRSIDIDSDGNSFVTGQFNNTVNFGSYGLTSNGQGDVFVTKIDDSGQVLWASKGGGTGSDSGFGISTDGQGNCYVIGEFDGIATFGDETRTANGSIDAFFWALNGENGSDLKHELSLSSLQDGDTDPENELQNISLSGTQLSITNGNIVDFGGLVGGDSTRISDIDADTKIQVEESPDEDLIRFDLEGTEYFTMHPGRLDFLNSGNSIFMGDSAGVNDDFTDNRNIGLGKNALKENTWGFENTAIGYKTLGNNLSGNRNVAIGPNNLSLNSSGSENIGIGYNNLFNNLTGGHNIALGELTMFSNQGGSYNIGFGYHVLESNTTGGNNIGMGQNALANNINGNQNIGIGPVSLNSNIDGGTNIGIGANSLYNNTSGDYNVGLGFLSLHDNQTGSSNTGIGRSADVLQNNLTKATAIGANAKVGCSDCLVLGEISKVNVGIGTSYPDTTLHLVGKFKYQDGTQSDGYVLTSDADGLASWQQFSGGQTIISDTDGDTKIQVEKNPDEDLIRFELAGTEYFQMHPHRIEFPNSGNSIYLGENAGLNDDHTNNKNIGIGFEALKTNGAGDNNIAIGYKALADNIWGDENIAIGISSLGKNTYGRANFALGDLALSENLTGNSNTGLGSNTLTNNIDGDRNVGIGTSALNSNTAGSNNTGIGPFALDANTTGDNNTSIGHSSDVLNGNLKAATAIGYNAKVGCDSCMVLGDISTIKVGIGTSNPDTRLQVVGKFKYQDGTQSAGYVLTSDASGEASWQPNINDNLGNHIATQNIQLGSNWISGDGGNEGIYVDGSGNVGIGNSIPLHKLDFGANLGRKLALYQNSAGTSLYGFGISGSTLEIYAGNDVGIDPRMVVKSSGNVGIGTMNPGEALDVVGSIKSSSSIKPGGIVFSGAFGPDGTYVGTGGNYLAFGHAATSEDFIGYKSNTFYFMDSPGGGDVNDPNVMIGGDLGVGTTSTGGRKLKVTGSTELNGKVYFTNGLLTGALGGFDLACVDQGNGKFEVRRQISSRRFKDNIKPINVGAERLLDLQLKSWTAKNDSTGNIGIGYIAEEVDSMGLKELVILNEDGIVESLKFSYFPFYSLELIKTHRTRIVNLEDQLGEIKKENENLKDELDLLKKELKKSKAQFSKSQDSLGARIKALETLLPLVSEN